MRKAFRQGLAAVLVIVCLFASGLFTAAGLAAGNDGVIQRIRYLSYLYPDGKYWNHQVGSAPTDPGSSWKYQSSVTDDPCTTHSGKTREGDYTCNYFDNGYQCYGFANKLFYEVFGVYCSRSKKYYSVDQIAPGDHVRYTNSSGGQHSVFVIGRSGNRITVAEANVGGTCLICWGREINIRELPMLYGFHASNWDTVNATPFEHEHIAETDEGRQATCTEDGLTSGSHCGVCGLVIRAQQTIPAAGHRDSYSLVNTAEYWDRIIYLYESRCANCGRLDTVCAVNYLVWDPGDINGDGVVDGRDLIRLMKYLAGDELVELIQKNGDLNRDNYLSEKDLVFLAKVLAGAEKLPQ